jgi:hypothetical protein
VLWTLDKLLLAQWVATGPKGSTPYVGVIQGPVSSLSVFYTLRFWLLSEAHALSMELIVNVLVAVVSC